MDPTRSDGLVPQIVRWLGERRTDDAAAARTRERWLRQVAQEEGTFAGVLLDLGEQERAVVVQVAGGRRHRGAIRAVGADFAVLSADGAPDVLLAFAGIVSARPEPRTPATVGDRAVVLDTALADVLVGLAGERPRVLLTTSDGTVVTGQLRGAGRDVLTVRLDGDNHNLLYVPLTAVAEIALTER